MFVAHAVFRFHDGGEQFGEIDRLGFLALQFGVEPAGVGNIRDQAVEPLHVVLDHGEQAVVAVLGLRQRQRFDRRAQRGERILQFMRDVGGEALDALDAAVKRVGHVAQRAGQVPDLVAALGEVGNFDARANAPPHALGAVGQPPHRTRDGAREQHRQNDHHRGGDQEDLQDRPAFGLDHLVDIGALRRQQQRAAHGAEALHRRRDRDDHFTA